MKKLRVLTQYECTTSFKYIWYFYAIQYGVVALIAVMIAIGAGGFQKMGNNCLELNTVIYVGILGVLGFKEDFRMLIQNGFTRKYIFAATISMFAFISGIMALVDTIVGSILHHLQNRYDSIYGSLYGYEHGLANWLWLFLAYMVVCSLSYFIVLVINKVGKKVSIYLCIAFGAVVLLITAAFRYILPAEAVSNIMELSAKAMGFMSDGTINYVSPMLTLIVIAAALGLASYAIIRRTELYA